MKKLSQLIASAILIVSVFASCSSSKAEPAPTPDPQPKEDEVELNVDPFMLSFDAKGAQPKTVKVTCNKKWTSTVDKSWVSLSSSADGKTLEVSVEDNPKMEVREAMITVKSSDIESKITVTQAAATELPIPTSLKVLAIGNSFSADAVEQELSGLIAAAGVANVVIGDMYIGGCPLDKHVENAKGDKAAYSYRKIVNGVMTKTADVKLSTALKDEQWDFISVQEGAGYHGFYNTTYNGTTHSMEPALTDLIKYVKETSAKKDFKLVYQSCWAAQKGYTGTKFSYYGFDQDVMYKMICEASQQILAAHPEIDILMNSMDAVQNARTSYIGDNMNRDGWHMNYTTGRYTVGCLWCEKLLGRSVVDNTYHPTTISDATSKVCQEAAHQAVLNPYKVTDLSYFVKPEGEGEGESTNKVLAKWYFSPDRSKSDGLIKSWTGQDKIGTYRYSNEPGERGYMNANDTGSGKLSYVQIDKTKWNDKGDAAGLSTLDVSNGGQPVMSAPMAGDYWQFETTGGYEFEEGTKLRIVYTYNPGNFGAKYWLIEYKDGDAWKPAYPTAQTTITTSGESIEYNIDFTTDQKVVDFTVTLENPTKEFIVRQKCCSSFQVNNKWFDYPNVKCVSRIAGDPSNSAKPCPEMDQII